MAHCRFVVKDYLRWMVGETCRTSSQMLGSWYLPRFLLRDGLLTYEHCLFDGHGNFLHFPVYNGKTVYIYVMSCRLTMLVNGAEGPEMFFKPVSKGPS